jgi:Gram-negative bacterial TonB protein C-terminal
VSRSVLFGKCALVAASSLLSASLTSAQLSKLDEVGERLAIKLKPLRPNPALVKVADFVLPDGTHSPQGHYFAWYFSGSLQRYSTDFLLVADHSQFDDELGKIGDPPSPGWTPEAIHAASPPIAADIVVLGTIEKKESTYSFNLRAVRASTGAILDSEADALRSSEFLESLSAPPIEIDGTVVHLAGVNGVTMPSCIKCPAPDYTDTARAMKANGSCALQVLVSPEGTTQAIRPVKLLGYGLDEHSYRTVKTWTFRPALDKDGKPVSAVVPVEMTFRVN